MHAYLYLMYSHSLILYCIVTACPLMVIFATVVLKYWRLVWHLQGYDGGHRFLNLFLLLFPFNNYLWLKGTVVRFSEFKLMLLDLNQSFINRQSRFDRLKWNTQTVPDPVNRSLLPLFPWLFK